MKKFVFLVMASFVLLSCHNANTTASEEQEGVQIDPQNKELGELNVKLLEYDDIDIPHNHVIPVKKRGKWGLVSKNGEEILPCNFKRVSYGGCEDVWIVQKNDSIGIVDKKGAYINELTDRFKSYTCIGNGLLFAVYNDALESQYIIQMKYQGGALLSNVKSVTPFSDGVIMAEFFGNYTLYSYEGDSLRAITPQYQHFTGDYSEGMYCVTDGWDGKYGFINSKGEVAVPFEFDKPCGTFSDGMALFSDSTERYGYINKMGEIVIPAQYYYATNFSDGLAYFANEENVGYIDKTGNVVIDTKRKFFYGDGFVKGFCMAVDDNDNMGIINKKGEVVVPFEYLFNALSDDVYVGRKLDESSKFGAFSYDGKQIIPFEYDELSDFNDGWAIAKLGDNKFIINKEGKTGILNLEEYLDMLSAEKAQAKQQNQESNLESLKQQLIEAINKEYGREVVTSIFDLTKQEDGTYKARFLVIGENDTRTYELYNISVDEDYNLTNYKWRLKSITPSENLPDGGIKTIDEVVKHAVGAVGY